MSRILALGIVALAAVAVSAQQSRTFVPERFYNTFSGGHPPALTIKPGEHGSTYGGNPLACKVAIAALQIIKDENLVYSAFYLGKYFRTELAKIKHPLIKTIRGKGLLNAIVLRKENESYGWNLCMKFMENGLLAKPTHNYIIRLAPPLCITKEQIDASIEIIRKSFKEFDY